MDSELSALVAEDESMLAEVMCWTLEDAGYRVVIASTGDDALTMFAREHFDILVTDIRMPGKTDGWALATQARQSSPNLPIVFISGYAPDTPKLPLRSAFVQKPFRPDDLVSAVRQFV